MTADNENRIMLLMNSDQNFRLKRQPVAEEARDRGFDVHVAYPHPEEDRSSAEKAGFPHHRFPMSRRGLNPIEEAWTVKNLVTLIGEIEPNLVHTLTLKPVVHGGIAARICSVPALLSGVTGLGTVFVDGGLGRRLTRIGVQRGLAAAFGHPNHRCIVQNTDDAEELQAAAGLEEEETNLVPGSGVDIDRFTMSPEPEGPPVVILPSRMLWDKGIKTFVEAAERLEEEDARFVLVGDTDPGTPNAVPRVQLERWDAEGPVEWWGWQEDMPSVYSRASIVCLPSNYREGVPKALIEGAASGRPLVSSEVPGCRDISKHGENGLLAPPGDAEALAKALRSLLNDPEKRRAMGARGRKLVLSSFSLARVVDATVGNYEELLRMQSAR